MCIIVGYLYFSSLHYIITLSESVWPSEKQESKERVWKREREGEKKGEGKYEWERKKK